MSTVSPPVIADQKWRTVYILFVFYLAIELLTALGKFPVTLGGDFVEDLVDLSNGEMPGAVDTIAPKPPLPGSRISLTPWFTGCW